VSTAPSEGSPRNPGAASDFVGISQVVDHSALKVNQAGIIATVLLTFVGSFFSLAFLTLIPLLGIVLLLGTFVPQLALFKQIYFKILKPAGIVKPRPVQDRPEPHNFAQGLGGVFLGIASALLFVTPIASIALALLVAALAFVNLAFGYCLGCQIFFQLEKRGLVRA
jgi:uncharacterized protein DUF4395